MGCPNLKKKKKKKKKMKWVNHETILFVSILKQLAQCVTDIV